MYKYLILFFLLIPQLSVAQGVVMNEIMASNRTALEDEDGDASDWIELYNRTAVKINLSGYCLSDDTLNIQKWKFTGATIEPGGYLIVFASDKNRQTSNLHTNFKIGASGETVVLADSNGIVVDRIDIPASAPDISYGRTSDGSLPWIFQTPTPGSGNTGKKIDGIADSVSASFPGGFYPSQISVALAAGSSRIFYTLDGSVPDSTKLKYTAPVTLQKTTVLKAMSIKENHLPGRIITNTYFINEATNLPVLSLSTDPYNLFDSRYGIYTNYKMDWERPAHVEFFEDNKSPGFSEECGIAIYGSQSREWDQKSFSVKFKQEYGVSKIEYPLFPGFYVTTFKSFVLRNAGNDFQYTHMRDEMMQTLVNNLDIDYLEYRPATTFINGEYWGIYNIREKISEHYIAYRHGVDPDNIDLLENNMSPIAGDSLHYRQFIDYISSHDMSTSAAYDYVNSMIDLKECILYFAAEAYYDNLDWPGGNIKYWRERSATGKWRWILFDLDFGFGLYAHGPAEDHIKFMFSTVETRYSNPPWATLLQRKLVENPSIRNQFINQIADLLNTNFNTAKVVNTINTLANHIAGEITKHRTRWNLTGENLTKMITFAQQRPAYLRDHVRGYFSCGSDGSITVTATEGGSVKLNSLNLKSTEMPFTGTYFQGNAIHLKAIPSPGYKFDGWSGAVTSQNDTLSFSISKTTSITANFSVDSDTSRGIVINEINYNSSNQFHAGDWIELYNGSKTSIDISGWIFADSDTSHAFKFPAGTLLGSDQYIVLTEDSSAFVSRFPNVKNFIGNMEFGLGSSGEFIKLVNNGDHFIDSLTYDDQSPWPAEPNGQGATLELFDPAYDNALGRNWKASAGHGSPGKKNSTLTALNETKEVIIPDNLNLLQNYPNPFNPTTTIEYVIPKTSYVLIRISDILGRELAVLVDEQKLPGTHRMKWDASRFPNGVYFCTMSVIPAAQRDPATGRNGLAGSYSQTKKLLLLK
jgi:hypothetical protein